MEIKGWSIQTNKEGNASVVGLIYGSNGFSDGTPIKTSAIENITTGDGVFNVDTLDSRYVLRFSPYID